MTESGTLRIGTTRRPWLGLLLAGLLPAGLLPSSLVAAPTAAVQDGQDGGGSARRSPVPSPLRAGPPALDLRSFLVQALDRSLEAEAAVLRRDAAGHAADALASPPNPTLEAEGPDSEGVAQLQLRQPLRLFGQGEARARLGRAERARAGRRLTAEHASVAREAARVWVETAARRREAALLERALGVRREALGRARAALDRGWGSRQDVQELRLEARAAERELAAVRGAARRGRRELARLLGLPAGEAPAMAAALAGDPDRATLLPFPAELPADAPRVALARADASVAEARLGRARTAARPVPSVGPMISVGKGLDPGVALELSLPLWNRNREGVRAARTSLEASEAAARSAGRTARAAYGRLLDRRGELAERLARLRTGELDPARRAVERWTASGELGFPVADRRRRARVRLLDLRREELALQRRLTLLEVDAAWRSGELLGWLRDPAAASDGGGA